MPMGSIRAMVRQAAGGFVRNWAGAAVAEMQCSQPRRGRSREISRQSSPIPVDWDRVDSIAARPIDHH